MFVLWLFLGEWRAVEGEEEEEEDCGPSWTETLKMLWVFYFMSCRRQVCYYISHNEIKIYNSYYVILVYYE